MAQHGLRLPASLQSLGGDFNKRRQAATATSSGITGLQIQELLARIKAQEATGLQKQKGLDAIANTLTGQGLRPDDPGLPEKQDELFDVANFLKSAQGSKLAAEIGVFPQDRPGAPVRDIVSGRDPNLRATPLEILKNTALNPSTKVGQDVKTRTVIGQGGKALGPSVRTVTDKTETKGPAGGLPGLGLPGTVRDVQADEHQRLQDQALALMQQSLDEAQVKAIYAKLKPGETIVLFDPDTKKVVVRRPDARTRRSE